MDYGHLKFCVVGVGRMGVRHLQAAQQLGMQIEGVADVSPFAVQSACQTFDLPASAEFSSLGAMLEKTRPDALVIATTAPSHCEAVIAASRAGVKHILCEKPMANSLAEAQAMIAACDAHGTQLAINHQMRFMPQYSEVKELLGSEKLGALVSVVVAGSNFGLAMNASHYFEMFRYLTNSSVASVQAWFEKDHLNNPRGAEFEDRSGRLLATGEQGQTLYIDFSAAAGHGLQCIYICRHGQIMVDELSGDMRIIARQAQYRDLPTTRYGLPADTENRAIAPADTVGPTLAVWQAMLNGESFPNGTVGLHALKCLVAAHESHRLNGQAVSLNSPPLPAQQYFKWA